MNTKLLRKVQKHILEEPRRLNMEILCDKVDMDLDTDAPPCGTIGCIAGWAHMLTMPKFPTTFVQIANADNAAWRQGRKKLGLDKQQASRLFSMPALEDYEEQIEDYQEEYLKKNPPWPEKFAVRYLNAKTAKQRAKVTAERIDHFIATRGKE